MEFSKVFHVAVPEIHCVFRFTYLKYFNTAPSTIMGVRYFLILSCLQSHCVPVEWLGAHKGMPSSNGSVHSSVNLVLVKGKALSRFLQADFIVFLCAAWLLCQRGLPPLHSFYPAPAQLSSCLPKHLATSTSVGKSFTSPCLCLLSNLPLDCELHEKPVCSHAQHLEPHLVWNKCPIDV